jgi:hypothetical protein
MEARQNKRKADNSYDSTGDHALQRPQDPLQAREKHRLTFRARHDEVLQCHHRSFGSMFRERAITDSAEIRHLFTSRVHLGEVTLPCAGSEGLVRSRIRHFLTFYNVQLGFLQMEDARPNDLTPSQVHQADELLSRCMFTSDHLLFWVYAGYREAALAYFSMRNVLPDYLVPPKFLLGA